MPLSNKLNTALIGLFAALMFAAAAVVAVRQPAPDFDFKLPVELPRR
jgi:hypothetical protein